MPIRSLAMLWAALALIMTPLSAADAQPGKRWDRGQDWELLGTQSVGFLVDRDTIRVGRQDGRFSAILLRVERNDIFIQDLKVVYLNGEVEDVPVRAQIRAGGQSRAIDLRGGDRFIREINVVYRSRPSFRGQAVLHVYGLQDRRPMPMPPPVVAGDWERLGAQTVGFGTDRDTIFVGMREGRFSGIQLRVHRNDIFIEDLKVVYANGEVDDIPVRDQIPAGGQTRIIDLKGGERLIRQVNLVYRSRPSFRGEAVVELWGLQDRGPNRGPIVAAPPPMAPPVVSGGWQLLGQKDVEMKLDRDVVRVGRYEGTFKSVRLRVMRHDIELRDVTIVYGNGQVDNWPIRRRVRDEEEGPIFDLRGRERVIQEVILTYRGTNPLDRTLVQVWGLR